jgi:hypothetical protein
LTFRVNIALVNQVSNIVSGGQTGADRAALDWAIERGIRHGGWYVCLRECDWKRNGHRVFDEIFQRHLFSASFFLEYQRRLANPN